MSSPAKKKSKEETKVCDHKPIGKKKCEKPVATSRPETAGNATLNPNRCADHQPCRNSGCHRSVGASSTYQKFGLCSKCYGPQRAIEKQEEKKQTIQNIVHNKKLPERTVAGASFLAAAYNDDQNLLSPPTALKDIDRDITTDDVLENQLTSLEASVPEVEIKSDSNNKKDFTLDKVKVFVINGDNEEHPGTLREVIEDGANGFCTLEGKDTKINCRLFAILRNALGKEIEKKYFLKL